MEKSAKKSKECVPMATPKKMPPKKMPMSKGGKK